MQKNNIKNAISKVSEGLAETNYNYCIFSPCSTRPCFLRMERKNKKGITISTSNVEGSHFKAVRGEMAVKGRVASLFALVEDMAAMCQEARLEKRISDLESYVYVYNDIPFPVSDRDVYTHFVLTKGPITKRLSITSTASGGGTEKTKPVRIEDPVRQWHFSPNTDDTTTVENFAHIGPTPARITNLMLVDSPFKTMIKMRDMIESGSYADATLPLDQ